MVAGSERIAVVLTALPEEYEAVRSHLVSLKVRTHKRGTVAEVGELPGCQRPVAIAQLGMGESNAAALTDRIINWLEPEALFFVGIAGGLDDGLALGDVVVATKVYAYAGGKQTSDGFLVRPDSWHPGHPLEQAARSALRRTVTAGEPHWTDRVPRSDRVAVASSAPTVDADRPQIHFKPLASGDVLLNSSECALREQLHRSYNDAVAIEMESAGFAHAAHLGGCDSLAVRGISDRADGHKYDTDRQGFRELAATHAAAAVIAVLTQIGPRTVDTGASAFTGLSRPMPPDDQLADALEAFDAMAGLEFRRNVMAMVRDRLALQRPFGIAESNTARDHLLTIARTIRKSMEPWPAYRALYEVMEDLRPHDQALVRLRELLGL